ncbi:MAG: hypothetical protein Q8O86_13560 [Dehalococcoidia bacterium]|nr:hypothetical protein [Dehalococcoidia bacterium]
MGSFALWLVLAVPLNCHNGLMSQWAASGHVHHVESADFPASGTVDGAVDGSSGPALCRHQGSSDGLPMAYGGLYSSTETNHSHASLEPSLARPALLMILAPHGLSPSPPEKPPSTNA